MFEPYLSYCLFDQRWFAYLFDPIAYLIKDDPITCLNHDDLRPLPGWALQSDLNQRERDCVCRVLEAIGGVMTGSMLTCNSHIYDNCKPVGTVSMLIL